MYVYNETFCYEQNTIIIVCLTFFNGVIMPRVDFEIWDRVFFLKIIAAGQMTYSSFIMLLYCYLLTLQFWTTEETARQEVLKYKWSVCGVTVLEFGSGTLLAFAANMRAKLRKKGVVAWMTIETILVPVSICLLMQLYYRIGISNKHYVTDPMYLQVNIAQVCFLLAQYLCIGYALDFLTHAERKPKEYDPSIRPESVYAPTYPKITTTESRHIRMSQSFFRQPSTSKNQESSSSFREKEVSRRNNDENEEKEQNSSTKGDNKEWTKPEDEISLSNEDSNSLEMKFKRDEWK